MLKCCVFSGDGDYKTIKDHMELFVGRFDWEFEIRPFMCPYRDWSIFILDTSGMRPAHELETLEATVKLMRSFPARIVGIWSHQTWEKLVNVADSTELNSPNCVRLECSDWCNKLAKAIKRHKRETHGH